MDDRTSPKIYYVARMLAFLKIGIDLLPRYGKECIVFYRNAGEPPDKYILLNFFKLRQFKPSRQRFIPIVCRGPYLIRRLDDRPAFTEDAICHCANGESRLRAIEDPNAHSFFRCLSLQFRELL